MQSLAIGEAGQGLERFVGSKVRELCEKQQMGVASTFFETGSTHRGARAIVSLTLGAFR